MLVPLVAVRYLSVVKLYGVSRQLRKLGTFTHVYLHARKWKVRRDLRFKHLRVYMTALFSKLPVVQWMICVESWLPWFVQSKKPVHSSESLVHRCIATSCVSLVDSTPAPCWIASRRRGETFWRLLSSTTPRSLTKKSCRRTSMRRSLESIMDDAA